MLIQCTKKLFDELKVAPGETNEESNPILGWHANFLKFGRAKFFVLVNDKNRYAIGDAQKDFFYPNEQMYKDLVEFSGQPVFNTEALVLKVTLELEKHNVWRRITVPAGINFPKLHDVLQTAFSWQNSHLHDFEIFEKKEDGSGWHDQPSVNLVCNEEAFAYQSAIPMKMETNEKLKEYVEAKVVYNYDFGDGWKHTIEVEEAIDDYTSNVSTCNDGEGNAPPEDVGGELGYETFLSIINDPSHADYHQTKDWGVMQGYEEFTIRDVNLQLEKL